MTEPLARVGNRADELNPLPRAIFDAPTKADRTRPAITLPGGRALFRCDVPPRSQPRRAFGLGSFSSIGCARRAGLSNFDTSLQPGSDPRRVGADAFHDRNHGGFSEQGVAKGLQGVAYGHG